MKNAFVDSNVLAYAADGRPAEAAKAAKARELLVTGTYHLSVQVIGEFIAVATHPRKLGMSRREALLYCDMWEQDNTIHPLTTDRLELAQFWFVPGNLSWRDSLIIAAANLADCEVIYTEDLNAGQTYGNVRVVNPFADRSDIEK